MGGCCTFLGIRILCSWSSMVVPQVKDLVLSLLWQGFDSLAQELPQALDIAKKPKPNKQKKPFVLAAVSRGQVTMFL